MIWGCFLGNKLGPIVFIDGKVNQDVYMGILDEYLVPFVEALKEDSQIDLEFQQDNVCPHTAKRTKAWLARMAEKYQLKIMDWPPNSPDMNPIEHLWAYLQRKLHQAQRISRNHKDNPTSAIA